jgi:putative redox protein
MEMRISFPGNKKVVSEFGGFKVLTDQPADAGGDASAPTPFELFLASIGTCAGIFVLSFCQKRGIPSEGIELVQRMDRDPVKHMVSRIVLEIRVPKDFPEKYKDGLVNAANLCTVKKHLHDPPQFEVLTRTV